MCLGQANACACVCLMFHLHVSMYFQVAKSVYIDMSVADSDAET